jgi:hypothetical protein
VWAAIQLAVELYMTDFAEGGNEPSGSVKTVTIKSADVCRVVWWMFTDLPKESAAFVFKVEM